MCWMIQDEDWITWKQQSTGLQVLIYFYFFTSAIFSWKVHPMCLKRQKWSVKKVQLIPLMSKYWSQITSIYIICPWYCYPSVRISSENIGAESMQWYKMKVGYGKSYGAIVQVLICCYYLYWFFSYPVNYQGEVGLKFFKDRRWNI